MAAGLFTISELRSVSGSSGVPQDAESFEWSASSIPPTSRGGARAAPLGEWDMGITQAQVRTDYPGAKRPSRQVLGPRRKPATFSGRWDDRYNFPGYARQELRRFEEMVKRGNIVRIQFQGQVFDGLITEFDPSYKGDWLVNYAFTFDVDERPDEWSADRSPAGPLTPIQRFDALSLSISSLQDVVDTAPRASMAGDAAEQRFGLVANITAARARIAAGIDDARSTRLGYLAAQFREVGSAVQLLLDSLASAQSEIELATKTAQSVIAYDTWLRGVAFNARLVLVLSIRGALDIEERDRPDATQLYRPTAGENLYKISRKFYGTPHSWRLISQRNDLSTFTMTGDELLIIPERSPG